MPSEVRKAADYALDRKAVDVTVLDLRDLSSATDFFVIATGRSDIHVRAIAEHILDSARGDGNRPEHIEGLDEGRWVLLDYIDHVVHVFHPSVRDFYRLEALWGDARSMPIPDSSAP
ncbi:MAG: ribosome silencing factor [Gemmatimonadetes bacterium]|nr:ribosome silencing factor [Gemmatimonadota bacterium]MYE15652.1 ribosome silencing factor [Gemmatimonadota bacterium]